MLEVQLDYLPPSLQTQPANWVTGIMLILRLEAGDCHGQTCHDYHSTHCLARLPILRSEHSYRDIWYQTLLESSVKINFRGNIITLKLATRISNIFLSYLTSNCYHQSTGKTAIYHQLVDTYISISISISNCYLIEWHNHSLSCHLLTETNKKGLVTTGEGREVGEESSWVDLNR